MEKRSFLMYTDWQPLFAGMTDEQAGVMLKAMYAYQIGEEYEITDPILLGAFNMVKIKFEADNEAYLKKCEKNKANGAKGGRPKKEEPKKQEYGEYRNVKLTEEEYKRLCEKNSEGKTAEAIKILDTYIESLSPAKKKEYLKKNHNLCMQNWVYGEVDKRKGQVKTVTRNNFNNFQQRDYDFSALERQLVENY